MQFQPKGIIPDMVTPLTPEGKINMEALRKVTRYLIEGGVHEVDADEERKTTLAEREDEIAPEEAVTVQNLDFESSNGDKMSGFEFQDDIGQTTFADRNVKHGGAQSLRMEHMETVHPGGGNCRVSQLFEAHGGGSWVNWSPTLRKRNPQALEKARRQYAEAILRQKFRQFLFFRQWNSLRRHANELGVRIIGDIPIFVAHDSADVWAHPELFYLFDNGNPMLVAGVPPDYYSETGQLWGNPLYRWDVHTASRYAWWLDRIRGVLSQVDIVRIDHFRGFAGYWEVKGRAKTAKNGHWVPAPGMDLFNTIQSTLGELPTIAEDLGVITPDVVELRDHFGLPGMKVIQFGFTFGPQDPFLPHNYVKNCVAYTGTHDSDTARGWYDRGEQALARENGGSLGRGVEAIHASRALRQGAAARQHRVGPRASSDDFVRGGTQ